MVCGAGGASGVCMCIAKLASTIITSYYNTIFYTDDPKINLEATCHN